MDRDPDRRRRGGAKRLLASSQANGKLDVWLAIATATAAAWTGGYVGYLLGIRGLGLPHVAGAPAHPPPAQRAGSKMHVYTHTRRREARQH